MAKALTLIKEHLHKNIAKILQISVRCPLPFQENKCTCLNMKMQQTFHMLVNKSKIINQNNKSKMSLLCKFKSCHLKI